MRRDWIGCASFSRRPKVMIQVHTIMMNNKGVDTFFFKLMLAVSKARLRRFKVKGIFKGDLRGKIFLNTEPCV